MKPGKHHNTNSDDAAHGHGAFSSALLWLWLGAIAPMLGFTLLIVWLADWTFRAQLTASLAAVVVAGVSGWFALRRFTRPIRAVTNMLDAIREGEYALRVIEPPTPRADDDPLAGLARSANRLGASMRARRWSARETAELLDVLLVRLDAAVVLIDDAGRLVTANPAARALLVDDDTPLIGKPCEVLGLGPFMQAATGSVIDHTFPTRAGRWEVRRAAVRLEGREHLLLVVSDLTRALRDEERRAWERLVQVLRHEVNNSLAPITSLAGSLARRVDRAAATHAGADPDTQELLADLGEGLGVITSRAGGLTRFLAAYTKLSRLPDPALRATPIGPLIRRIAALQTAVPVAVAPDDGPSVLADAAQLEQALLNLVTNAAEATLERHPNADNPPGITIEWSPAAMEPGFLEIRVEDRGIGLPETENLFVPFFTTKPTGTGIGLVLSRRIIEAHGGRLTLAPGPDAQGCTASLTLRLNEPDARGPSHAPLASDGRRPSEAEASAAPRGLPVPPAAPPCEAP